MDPMGMIPRKSGARSLDDALFYDGFHGLYGFYE